MGLRFLAGMGLTLILWGCSPMTSPMELKTDAVFGGIKGVVSQYPSWKRTEIEGNALAFESEPEGALALVLVSPIKEGSSVWGMARQLPVRFEHYRMYSLVPKKVLGIEAWVGLFRVSHEGRSVFVRSVTWKRGRMLYDTLLITPRKDQEMPLKFYKDLTFRVMRLSGG